MTLNQFFDQFPKVLRRFKNKDYDFKFFNPKYVILIFLTFILVLTFMIFTSIIDTKNKKESQNFESLIETDGFANLAGHLITKINNPYKEIKYVIQNNDSIEKILKKLDVSSTDIKNITLKLKEEKLTNIYTGRMLNIVLKKLNNNTKNVVNLSYPINNTLSIDIRKSQDNFIIKKNIVKLYKKEVVIKNEIKNNLYSAAVEAGIEPNIIIEFARIFGLRLTFKEILEKESG